MLTASIIFFVYIAIAITHEFTIIISKSEMLDVLTSNSSRDIKEWIRQQQIALILQVSRNTSN